MDGGVPTLPLHPHSPDTLEGETKKDMKTRKVQIDILKVKTGETRTIEEDYGDEEDYNPFFWSDGNFSCDCNRAIMFGDEEDIPCGNTEFRVNIREEDEILYSEFSISDGHIMIDGRCYVL